MLTLPILPFNAYRPDRDTQIFEEPEHDPFYFPHAKYWGPRATWLLAAILSQCHLERSAEIAILTTTDWTYVSTCLSVTAFNFARISRVVNAGTKVVIVVHEFGYPFESIGSKVQEWKQRGIVVVEDCAHLVGLDVEGGTVGSFGDFTIVSLPKLFPAFAGGLLLATRPIILPRMTGDEEQASSLGVEAAKRYLRRHKWFSRRRRERHQIIKEGAGAGVLEPSTPSIPFATYVRRWLGRSPVADVEHLSTLSNEYFLIPTNPLVDEKVFREVANGL